MDHVDVILILSSSTAVAPARALLREQQDEQALYGHADPVPTASEAAQFLSPRGWFILAYAEEDAVGCGGICLSPEDSQIAELRSLYVRLPERGKGIGRQMLDRLERFAGSRMNAVVARARTRSDQAVKFLEREGYRRVRANFKVAVVLEKRLQAFRN